jgi:hypothetical protein
MYSLILNNFTMGHKIMSSKRDAFKKGRIMEIKRFFKI